MDFFSNLRSGTVEFFRAYAFTRDHGMRWLFLVPIVLWLLLTFGLYALLQQPADTLSAWASEQLSIPVGTETTKWWSNVKVFLNGAREMVVAVLLKIAILYLLYIANKYLVLILLSPLLAYASERTEELITGRSFPFSWPNLLKDALRGALVAIRNGTIEIGLTILIWTTTLVMPILAPISLVLLFGISAYFYGFSMFDYIHERHRLGVSESVRAVNRRIGAVVANGALFSLLLNVPLFGVMFAPVMASVGAVLASVNGGDHRGIEPNRSHRSDKEVIAVR
ncbi:MAG: EI24 domain-containing protein [Flavobacteriales bacterium]|nr:EI24 domain-containing protein [Flavobacteriales bacterium]